MSEKRYQVKTTALPEQAGIPNAMRNGGIVRAHGECSFCEDRGPVAQLHGTNLAICGSCVARAASIPGKP